MGARPVAITLGPSGSRDVTRKWTRGWNPSAPPGDTRDCLVAVVAMPGSWPFWAMPFRLEAGAELIGGMSSRSPIGLPDAGSVISAVGGRQSVGAGEDGWQADCGDEVGRTENKYARDAGVGHCEYA